MFTAIGEGHSPHLGGDVTLTVVVSLEGFQPQGEPMTTKTTTTNPSIDAFDLRPALELRADADRIIARLRAGDRDPALFAEGRALLEAEYRIAGECKAAMAVFGHDDAQPHVTDHPAWEVVSAIGTGQLGYEIDHAEGHSPEFTERWA